MWVGGCARAIVCMHACGSVVGTVEPFGTELDRLLLCWAVGFMDARGSTA